MNTGELKRKVSKALSSSSTRIQSEMLTALLQQVQDYVQQIKEEEEIVSELRSLERQAYGLQQSTDENAATELKELQMLIQEAEDIKRDLTKKRNVIKDLQRDVEALHRELRKI